MTVRSLFRQPRAALLPLLLAAVSPLLAQLQPLAVGEIRATPSLLADRRATNDLNTVNRVIEALDGQLLDRLNETRKFELLVRSDLRALYTEWDLANSGNARASAVPQELTVAKHLVTITMDDFRDLEESLVQGRETLVRRTVSASAVLRIFEVGTGRLNATANIQTETTVNRAILAGATATGGLLEEAILATARDLAQKLSDRVVDVIFPAKVLSKRDTTLLLNRGDGTNIRVGQQWEIYAVGEELIDPDTGRSLGADEAYIGKVRVRRITPNFAECDIVEDLGIERGQVARLLP